MRTPLKNNYLHNQHQQSRSPISQNKTQNDRLELRASLKGDVLGEAQSTAALHPPGAELLDGTASGQKRVPYHPTRKSRLERSQCKSAGKRDRYQLAEPLAKNSAKRLDQEVRMAEDDEQLQQFLEIE